MKDVRRGVPGGAPARRGYLTMRGTLRVLLMAAASGLAGVLPSARLTGDLADAASPVAIADILNTAQLGHIARRRAELTVPEGSAYRFTFEKGPGYELVEVYYLVEQRRRGGRIVRELAEKPSAVVYVVTAPWNWEIKKHLSEKQMAEVLGQMLAARQEEGRERMVRVRRALFDIGSGNVEEFVKGREQYYSDEHGRPLFDKWPPAWRTPSGQFTVSIVQTSVVQVPAGAGGVPAVQAGQFFGYSFPVLDELLTAKQKEKLAEDVRRVNVQEGEAAVLVDDVEGFGPVKLHYLVREGVPLPRPTAMESAVRVTAKEIQDDPVILRKYLAPEGVAYLMKRIRSGERAGKRLKEVELIRMHFDVVPADAPDAQAAHAEFKKEVQNYCRRDELLKPRTWPDRFRRPDGKFDVELTSTRIVWMVARPQ